jgi:hypothetical protein
MEESRPFRPWVAVCLFGRRRPNRCPAWNFLTAPAPPLPTRRVARSYFWCFGLGVIRRIWQFDGWRFGFRRGNRWFRASDILAACPFTVSHESPFDHNVATTRKQCAAFHFRAFGRGSLSSSSYSGCDMRRPRATSTPPNSNVSPANAELASSSGAETALQPLGSICNCTWPLLVVN